MDKDKLMQRIELAVAIMLGVTAVLMVWASWQSSLHGGNRAANYTGSNNAVGEANSLYNEAAQYVAQDMDLWNRISDLRIDLAFAQDAADADEIEKVQWKLDQIMADNVTQEMEAAIDWADSQADYASPFDNEDFMNSYYAQANVKYEEGRALMEQGQRDSRHSGRLGLVAVIYAAVLFMLGITGNFHTERTKHILLGVAAAGFIFATVLLCTVPMAPLGAVAG